MVKKVVKKVSAFFVLFWEFVRYIIMLKDFTGDDFYEEKSYI